MSAQKWTPEPWVEMKINGQGHRIETLERGIHNSDMEVATTRGPQHEANAARAVACVEALANRDPAKLAALEAACEAAINAVPLAYSDDNAITANDALRAALAAFRGQP